MNRICGKIFIFFCKKRKKFDRRFLIFGTVKSEMFQFACIYYFDCWTSLIIGILHIKSKRNLKWFFLFLRNEVSIVIKCSIGCRLIQKHRGWTLNSLGKYEHYFRACYSSESGLWSNISIGLWQRMKVFKELKKLILDLLWSHIQNTFLR